MAETKSLKTAWKECTTGDKVLMMIMTACYIAVFVMAALHISGVWKYANVNYIIQPIIGTGFLLEALFFRKRQCITALIFLCAAMFIFITMFIVFFIK